MGLAVLIVIAVLFVWYVYMIVSFLLFRCDNKMAVI